MNLNPVGSSNFYHDLDTETKFLGPVLDFWFLETKVLANTQFLTEYVFGNLGGKI